MDTFEFNPDEIEHLAALEHWRWCVDRWLDGWGYATEKSVDELRHHLLMDYELLSEAQKEYDRQAIRNIPQLLAIVDRSIEREKRIISEMGQTDKTLTQVAEAERVGSKPIVVTRINDAHDLALVRDLQKRGVRTELALQRTVSALLTEVSEREFRFALNAAEAVEPADVT